MENGPPAMRSSSGLRWVYRLGQALIRLVGNSRWVDYDLVGSILPPAALDLYKSMPLGDQIHGFCVLQKLCEAGSCSPDIEQAALLHDVGKAEANLTLAHRTLVVLLERIDDSLLERLASDDPGSWRYPFYVHKHHAQMGARLCSEAGCPALTVELVRYHECDSIEEQILWKQIAALQAADDLC